MKVFAAVLSLVALSPLAANAILITDTESPMVRLTSGGSTSSYTVTHDLRPTIPNLYQATAGALVLAFADDSTSDASEWAKITLDLIGFVDQTLGTIEVGGTSWLYDWQIFGLSGNALLDLNADGLLRVTVASNGGDFWWKQSVLALDARPVSVPEPGTLLLLGSGLLAVGLVSRRRASAKK